MRITMSDVMVGLDNICDYIPGVSTLTNGIDLFEKYYTIPQAQASNSPKIDLKDRYWRHINHKEEWRSWILLVPVLGNFVIAIADIVTKLINIGDRKQLIDNLGDNLYYVESDIKLPSWERARGNYWGCAVSTTSSGAENFFPINTQSYKNYETASMIARGVPTEQTRPELQWKSYQRDRFEDLLRSSLDKRVYKAELGNYGDPGTYDIFYQATFVEEVGGIYHVYTYMKEIDCHPQYARSVQAGSDKFAIKPVETIFNSSEAVAEFLTKELKMQDVNFYKNALSNLVHYEPEGQ